MRVEHGAGGSSKDQVGIAFDLKPMKGWGWMVGSGVASIALSLIILMGLPVSSLVALGIILGINFISSGFALIMVGGGARQAVDA